MNCAPGVGIAVFTKALAERVSNLAGNGFTMQAAAA
jgi:hypothetical protein